MKVNNNISIPSFRGINVNNRQITANTIKDSKVKNLRPRQAEELESLEEKLKFIREAEQQQKVKSADAITQEANDNNYGSRFVRYLGLGTGKNLYIDKKEGVEKEQDVLQKKSLFADRMMNLVSDTIKKIRRIDCEDLEKELGSKPEIIEAPVLEGIKNVAGYNLEMSVLNKEFINKVKREKEGEDTDIFGSILFFGPYGNGKTYITRRVAQESGCHVAKVTTLGKDYSEQTMQKIYSAAEKSEERFQKDRTRTVIFIDETDKILRDNPQTAKEFEEFIKTCSDKYHCTVFAATNDPLDLNLNMNDPGVFPVKMSIDPPNKENAVELFKYYIDEYPHGEMNYEELETALRAREKEVGNKFSNGRIKGICTNGWFNKSSEQLTKRDILYAIQQGEPALTKEQEDKFQKDYQQLIAGKKSE